MRAFVAPVSGTHRTAPCAIPIRLGAGGTAKAPAVRPVWRHPAACPDPRSEPTEKGVRYFLPTSWSAEFARLRSNFDFHAVESGADDQCPVAASELFKPHGFVKHRLDASIVECRLVMEHAQMPDVCQLRQLHADNVARVSPVFLDRHGIQQ